MKCSFSLLPASLALCLVMCVSCVHDDRSDCFLEVGFRYSYNVKDADAFVPEVRSVELYIFDSEGKFVESRRKDAERFPRRYRMKFPSLGAGSYTFVALGRNHAVNDCSREFEFSPLVQGLSRLEDLSMRLRAEGEVCGNDFAALYNGVCQVDVEDGAQEVTVEMRKLTNSFRIILMPYRGDTVLDAGNYDIRILGNAAHLDYKGDKYCDSPMTFIPTSCVTVSDGAPGGTAVNSAVVADLRSSRLLYEDRAMLVICGAHDGEELLRLNLPWFLSLQGIGEHRREWGNQEYLDRQDSYSVTFFVDGDLFVRSRIIVNGWVLSLDDISLI